MGETADPRQALVDGDVATRSAAARDLAREGSWDDVETLVELALGDRSSAVRLYTAAAAGDILARHRGAAGQERLTLGQRRQVVTWVGRIDPGANPGILTLLSACADREASSRLVRMTRDPRIGVRMGAVAALRRMVLSAGPLDVDVEALLLTAQRDRRTPADVQLELVRLAGEVGWDRLDTSGHGEAGELARERQRLRSAPTALDGLWIDHGRDVLETGEPRHTRWLLVVGGEAWIDGEPVPLAEPRLVWAPVYGESSGHRSLALQDAGVTWWHREGKVLVKGVDDLLESLPAHAAVGMVAASLVELDGPLAVRARGLLRLRAGDVPGSLELLEQLAGYKRPRTDVWYWLARAREAAGDRAGALEALAQYVGKAGQRERYLAAGLALQEELTEG